MISIPVCPLAENDDDGFDLIEPSLIQQLKKILDQYPDDDQILKVTSRVQTASAGLFLEARPLAQPCML